MARDVSLEVIDDFLSQKRIAMVGISREPRSFSVSLFEELCRRGYDMVPVNPNTPNVLGHRCFARLQDIEPRVDTVILMTSPAQTEKVVADCAEAGIHRVWMYRAAGKGSVSPKAVAFCRERGMQVVPGECPFMFLPGADGIHRFHGCVREITARLPNPTDA